MCADFKQILNVRPIDRGPSDILRRCGVCISRVSATHAAKLRLAGPIPFIHTTALWTSPRGVAWIDKDNRNAGALGFVTNKTLQLAECPGVQTGPLLFLSPYPAANPLQLFEGNPATGAFSNGNYFFRNLVVDISSEPALFDPALTQEPPSAPGAFGLQLAAQSSMSRPNAAQLSARIVFAIAGLSDSNHAEINADKIRDCNNSRRWLINRNKQEPFAVAINQIGFATLEIEKSPVTFTADKRDSLPSVHAPDAYCLSSKIPGQNARIVGDRAVNAEEALRFMVKFISVGNFGYEPHHNLSGKREFLTNSAVTKPVNRELPKLFRVPSQLADAISRRVSSFKRRKQNRSLFRQGQQLHLSGQFHSIPKYDKPDKNLKTQNGIPPPPKGGGLLPENL
jgi:hypothetical protein